jgi:hypothetical protein
LGGGNLSLFFAQRMAFRAGRGQNAGFHSFGRMAILTQLIYLKILTIKTNELA